MFTFVFTYSNGESCVFENINEVIYYTSSKVIVKEDEILSFKFPINKTLHLYSENTNITVKGDGLSHIKIFKKS